ncbi:MAG: sialidase family protein [Eubacteriales bacterium]|nr:sialidase family protein [Eubacteriales bacterium]
MAEILDSEILFEEGPRGRRYRSSEGAFIDLLDGRLLFAYSRFEGESPADDAAASIYAIESRDAGQTWSEPRLFLDRSVDAAQNLMCVNFLRMKNGDLGLFYFSRKSKSDGRIFLRRSQDEGLSFAEATPCTTGRGYYVTNNDRILRLSSGRIIVPAAYHRTLGELGAEYWDGCASTYFFYSDDDGQSFCEGPVLSLHSRISRSGLQEPGCIELRPQQLYAYMRTDLGAQYESFSFDGGSFFSTAEVSPFSSPCSPMSMKKAANGCIYAIYNPIPVYLGESERQGDFWTGHRSPLVLTALVQGSDGRYAGIEDYKPNCLARTALIEDDPEAGYAYTAMHFNQNGDLLIAYCAGEKKLADASCLVRLRMRRIPASELDRLAQLSI